MIGTRRVRAVGRGRACDRSQSRSAFLPLCARYAVRPFMGRTFFKAATRLWSQRGYLLAGLGS